MKYENRIVAFIDILGFKEIVRQSEHDSTKIELLDSVLKYLKNWEVPEKWDLKFVEIEEDAQNRGVDKFDIKGHTNSTSFSDSIVVSVKVNNNINEVTTTLVANLAYMGAFLLKKGILFRGGLTVGNIIHNDNGTVFGQGLVDAYMLECGNAKYPRIIMSDKLIKKLNYPILSKKDSFPYRQYIDRFEDGCVGFHQMIYFQVVQAWNKMTVEELSKDLDAVRKVIVKGLDGSFERPEVFEKYKWLKKQYNKLLIDNDSPKMNIRELNDGIAGHNIHYSYTDNFYNNRRK